VEIYNRIEKLYNSYAGIKTIIGKSVLGRNIYAFFVGKEGGKIGICQYAVHAREWITSLLAEEHIKIGVFSGAWFLPLINPDGAELSANGISSVKNEDMKKYLVAINKSRDFSRWKANADAVDLNVNFDAGWGKGAENVFFPSPSDYVGGKPFSEPESAALRDFTLKVNPAYTVSFHTSGEEIYWRYNQPLFSAVRDKKLGVLLSKSTGYPLKTAEGSHGGYKDWCISRLKIPAFTIEAGKGVSPLPLSALKEDIIPKTLMCVRELSSAFG